VTVIHRLNRSVAYQHYRNTCCPVLTRRCVIYYRPEGNIVDENNVAWNAARNFPFAYVLEATIHVAWNIFSGCWRLKLRSRRILCRVRGALCCCIVMTVICRSMPHDPKANGTSPIVHVVISAYDVIYAVIST